jgi:Tol biopolymer transport system component
MSGIFLQDDSELFLVDPNTGDRKALTELASEGVRPRSFAVSFDGAGFVASVKDGDGWKLNYRRFGDRSFTTVASSREQIDSIAFHPNGRSIFYSTSSDGTQQIFEATTGGTVPIQVSSGGTDLSLHDVSADGGKILYGTVSETSDLWSVASDGGTPSVVANDTASEFWPNISPDAKAVAYETTTQADRPYRGSVMVRQFDPKIPPTLVAQDGFAPVWSRDGQWVAYFRRTESGIAIWKVRPSGADAVKLAEGQIAVPGYSTTPYLKLGTNHLSWSPNGRSVTYSAKNDGVADIWLGGADGSGARPMFANTDRTRGFCCTAWDRDGTRVAVVAEPSSTDKKVWKLIIAEPDIAGSAKEIYSSDAPFRLLGWDESGDVLVSQRATPAESSATPAVSKIYRLTPAGETRASIAVTSAYSNNINLSPDGRTIFYVSRVNDISSICSVPSTGGAPKSLYTENDPKVLISSLAISGDGKTIVYGKQTRTNVLSMLTN